MIGTMVFKYGPPEPSRPSRGLRDMLIKYGPPESNRPEVEPQDMVIKYGPPESSRPEVKPELKEKEIKSILRQIAKCLKKIKKLLEQPKTATSDKELDSCEAEFGLLCLKLNDLRISGGNRTTAPDRKGCPSLIVYIVTAPAKLVKKLVKKKE